MEVLPSVTCPACGRTSYHHEDVRLAPPYVQAAALSLASRPTSSRATMNGVSDNVAIFRFLGVQFPDEHITRCLDATVVSQTTTKVEDPEDADRHLLSLSYVLACPHVRKFEVTVQVTAERPPE